jgi:hypothetical protein
VRHDKHWADISESANDMIHWMLQVDPDYRSTVTDALRCNVSLVPEELATKDLGGARADISEYTKDMICGIRQGHDPLDASG